MFTHNAGIRFHRQNHPTHRLVLSANLFRVVLFFIRVNFTSVNKGKRKTEIKWMLTRTATTDLQG
jgi:hypothetical protein